MNDLFNFENQNISTQLIDGEIHFCCRDVARICGYKSNLTRRKGDRIYKDSSGRNFISLSTIGNNLSHRTGEFRETALRLHAKIERDFLSAMPVKNQEIPQANLSDNYDRKTRELQMQIKLDELRIEECKASKHLKEVQMTVLQAEKELAMLLSTSPRLRVIEGIQEEVNS